MLPSASAFVDPLFSTGIPLTLLGVERLCMVLQEAWGTEAWRARLQEYTRVTRLEADATAGLIAACYDSMACFPIFASLTMLYFAAASYGEMARRLGRAEMAGGFLSSEHAAFGPALRRCIAHARARSASGTPWAPSEIAVFEVEVAQAVSILNVAGLCDSSKRNRYGVDLEDTIRAAAKLGLSPSEMRAVLREAPWAQ
ncbi:hypothetical protein CCAX7_13830 [Capsulimonas corticalis]|uniref:Uncharacterized protein n=1 Tax=Capsulimonas corticalis TaxID=2219043 RepID=A0A402D6R2_9BACT|nr:tryptophan 7-halogenase [Capsulimonas corticalis]BDI29332.1 hypothetical protein CCAX7_13830 [Capsulimonas corticalis]